MLNNLNSRRIKNYKSKKYLIQKIVKAYSPPNPKLLIPLNQESKNFLAFPVIIYTWFLGLLHKFLSKFQKIYAVKDRLIYLS